MKIVRHARSSNLLGSDSTVSIFYFYRSYYAYHAYYRRYIASAAAFYVFEAIFLIYRRFMRFNSPQKQKIELYVLFVADRVPNNSGRLAHNFTS